MLLATAWIVLSMEKSDESYVVQTISDYCVEKGYEVDGFPMQKRAMARNQC